MSKLNFRILKSVSTDKSNFQWYMLGSINSERAVSQNPRISFKLITLSILYLNAGTELYEKFAALNVVHYMPSKLLVIFSEPTIFKKRIS